MRRSIHAVRAALCAAAAAACLAAACGDGLHPAGSDAAPADAAPADAAGVAPCVPAWGSVVAMRRLPQPVSGGAVLVTGPPGPPGPSGPPGDDRLFVVEQRGAIRIYRGEVLAPQPFLDLSAVAGGPVAAGGELGLLGLAFHPDYAHNRALFVFYTAHKLGDPAHPYVDVVARYQASAADPDRAEPTGRVVLGIDDFASTHNAGMIEFGADGYLYIATGDGGGEGDPARTGQDASVLLGKLLRIDVDHPAPGRAYGIPPDNPFAAGGGAPEVFALGLRNPWRWSFDRATGDLWIGDVGEGQVEELDVLLAGSQRGANLGWSAFEGTSCCRMQPDHCQQQAPLPCDATGQTFPLDQRRHADGWHAIIGGQVYRGACYPDLAGWYFYTDNVRGGLAKARLTAPGALEIVDLPGAFPASPTSLHADARGELYETDTAGNVYHLEAGP